MKRRAALLVLGLVLIVAGAASRGRALPPVDPGPFWPLVVGHTGQRYRDALPAGATYSLQSGALPPGLALEATGAVAGTPSQAGAFEAVLAAREPSGKRYPVRVHVTVRDAAESSLAATPASFEQRGPRQVIVDDLRLDLTSTFDQQPFRTRVRIARPATPGPWPTLLFHRGRGFDHDSYQAFHEHIASWGIAVASIEDRRSFTGATFRGEVDRYDLERAELGMESASGVVEAVSDELLRRAADPLSPFANAFDADRLFFAGHSRGGGAVHASHQRSFELRLRGLIYLMAFDLRYFAECAPPGAAPAYPIFDRTPRTPSLIIAAENDGDLTYPIADQLIDRAQGPTTQVTLYGGVHNLISDSHPAEGNAKITRDQERVRVADWIVAFVRRWSARDTSLDGRLYGGAHQGSALYGIASWCPSARTLLLEDAQDGDANRNLRGRNLVNGLRRREQTLYPDVGGDHGSLNLRHTHLTPTAATSVWRVALDAPLDITGHRRLALRLAQTGPRGWSGVGVWLRVVDAAGGQAWLRVHEPSLTSGSLLPRWTSGGSTHDRFVEVQAPLAQLSDAGSVPLDKRAITGVDLVLVVRDGPAVRSVVADAIRLE